MFHENLFTDYQALGLMEKQAGRAKGRESERKRGERERERERETEDRQTRGSS